MVSNLFDKIIFGGLLLTFFQYPLLNDAYLQQLNGYYLSHKVQVERFRQNAKMHNYPDIYAMIEDFKRNSNPAVQKDGEQKELIMGEYQQVTEGIEIFKNGHVFEKVTYMFSPERWSFLREVLRHFKPGIPLTIDNIVYSLLAALLLSGLIMWPFKRTSKPQVYVSS